MELGVNGRNLWPEGGDVMVTLASQPVPVTGRHGGRLQIQVPETAQPGNTLILVKTRHGYTHAPFHVIPPPDQKVTLIVPAHDRQGRPASRLRFRLINGGVLRAAAVRPAPKSGRDKEAAIGGGDLLGVTVAETVGSQLEVRFAPGAGGPQTDDLDVTLHGSGLAPDGRVEVALRDESETTLDTYHLYPDRVVPTRRLPDGVTPFSIAVGRTLSATLPVVTLSLVISEERDDALRAKALALELPAGVHVLNAVGTIDRYGKNPLALTSAPVRSRRTGNRLLFGFDQALRPDRRESVTALVTLLIHPAPKGPLFLGLVWPQWQGTAMPDAMSIPVVWPLFAEPAAPEGTGRRTRP